MSPLLVVIVTFGLIFVVTATLGQGFSVTRDAKLRKAGFDKGGGGSWRHPNARPAPVNQYDHSKFPNRNETKHLPYGEGTLRAEPLRDALERFERPATVITESPDEESNQAIGAVLGAEPPRSSASRTS